MAIDKCIKKIKVFYHVCMINHWFKIVEEHIKLMIEYGLYDRVDKIYIGAVGKEPEFKKLKEFAEGFPKMEIVDYDSNLLRYEFLTLKILQKHSQKEDFYGLYFHTKGCSYPSNEGGKFWRDYMNWYNIVEWNKALCHIERDKYDMYGVKLLSARKAPAYALHYSGNFFWFNSEYIRTLCDINTLDQTNRINAELWACSNYPIAATGCQEFVDYNNKGKFVPYE